MLCKACGHRPRFSEQSIYCDDEECRRERAGDRKRAQRERGRERVVAWPREPRPALDLERSERLLGHRRRIWMRGGSSGPVRIIEGVDWEIPAMTGDNTQRCRCGLELRAPTGRELLKVIACHNGVCVVLHKGDHWSVRTMLAQKVRAHRPHREVPTGQERSPSPDS
jgi:hypothetical protein